VYAILVYDVQADRTQDALKIGRRYLNHIQNSVLEGEITKGDLQHLRNEMEEFLEEGESIIIYELSSDNLLNRQVYGEDPNEESQFL
jgi:CRISPR-associated protein Cas2